MPQDDLEKRVITQGPAPTHEEIEQEKEQQMNDFREILTLLTEPEEGIGEKPPHERPDRHHWARGV